MVHAGNTTYTEDNHPYSTTPRYRNNMNVYQYKNTEDSQKHKTNMERSATKVTRLFKTGNECSTSTSPHPTTSLYYKWNKHLDTFTHMQTNLRHGTEIQLTLDISKLLGLFYKFKLPEVQINLHFG